MSKLQSTTVEEVVRRQYVAAKALVIIVPVLGLTYLLTILGPSGRIFQSVRATLLSLQGAVISLPYCYLNAEIQGIIQLR